MPSHFASFRLVALLIAIILITLFAISCAAEPTQVPTSAPRSQEVEPHATTPPTSTMVPASIPTATPTHVPPLTPIRKPNARLVASAADGQAPFTLELTNLSENADAFQWDFGDGGANSTTIGGGPVTHEYTKSGTYTVTLSATREDSSEVVSTATVSLTVNPGPVDKLVLDTTEIILTPGENHSLSVEALDQFDNAITGLTYEYHSEESAGLADDQGNFTAGMNAGSYESAVIVEANDGSITKTASVNVTINHGTLDRVLLTPEKVDLDIGQSQEFSAEAMDSYGNLIPDLEIRWEAAEGLGTVDNGVLTAGTLAGSYGEGLMAIAVLDGINVEASSAVIEKLMFRRL